MRYFLSFLLTIGLVILAIVLVVSSLHGSSTSTVGSPLVQYTYTGTQVEMTIDGPVNANQSHYELQMTVGSSLSELDLDQGYTGTVLQSKTYTNNPASYAEFLQALAFAGFNEGITTKGVNTNPTGYCPFGNRYTYQINNPYNSNQIENFWSTTCGQGTFKGNASAVLRLFEAQMPDYASIVDSTDLSN